jgi:hypothetical protein
MVPPGGYPSPAPPSAGGGFVWYQQPGVGWVLIPVGPGGTPGHPVTGAPGTSPLPPGMTPPPGGTPLDQGQPPDQPVDPGYTPPGLTPPDQPPSGGAPPPLQATHPIVPPA